MGAQLTSKTEQVAELEKIFEQTVRVGHDFFATQLEDFDLTVLQYGALAAIERLGPDVAVGEVGDAIGAPPSSMTGLTNRLVNDGLIERYTPPQNRRTVVLRTTPAGQELVRTIDARKAASLERFLEDFSDDEIFQFRRFMEKMKSNMERRLDSGDGK